MKITEKDVRYVAALANLDLEELEVAKLTADLDAILAYVDKLNELDTAVAAPMAQVLFDAPPELSLRSDATRPSFPQAESLRNAPEQGAGHFKVPKVIER